jgi:hypothetical protein
MINCATAKVSFNRLSHSTLCLSEIFVFVWVCVSECVSVCVCEWVCEWVCVCECVWVCVCECEWVWVSVWECVWVCVSVCECECVWVCVCVCVCVCEWVCVSECVWVRARAYCGLRMYQKLFFFFKKNRAKATGTQAASVSLNTYTRLGPQAKWNIAHGIESSGRKVVPRMRSRKKIWVILTL